MPFTDEPSGTLGSKDLLNNPDVLRALNSFMPGMPPLNAERASSLLKPMALGDASSVVMPWLYVFAIDGSNYETVMDSNYPHQVGYVKVGGVLMPLQEMFDLQQRFTVGTLDIEMLKRQRVTAAVVLPGQNVVRPEEGSLAFSFRKTLHEFMKQGQDALPWLSGNRSFYDVLADILDAPADRPLAPLSIRCPRCGQTRGLSRSSWPTWQDPDRPFERVCGAGSCTEPLFLIDVLSFHEAIMEQGSNRNLLNEVMLLLEKLMALHWVQAGMTSSVLVLLDGPLAIFNARQQPLVPAIRTWLSTLMGQANPAAWHDPAHRPSVPGLLGVTKQGQMVHHAQAIHQRFPDLPSGMYPMTPQYMNDMVHLRTGQHAQTFSQRDRGNLGACYLVKTAMDRWYVVDTPVWHRRASERLLANTTQPDERLEARLGRAMVAPEQMNYWKPILAAVQRFDGPRYGGSLLPMTFAHELVSIARDPSGVVLTQAFRDTMRSYQEVRLIQAQQAEALTLLDTARESSIGPVAQRPAHRPGLG